MKGRDGWEMQPKPFWGGRFFYVLPKSSGILHVVSTYGPAHNEIALDCIGKVANRYPFATYLIYDMACEILKDASARRSRLWNSKTYTVGKFRGVRHKASRPENPYSIPALLKRLRGKTPRWRIGRSPGLEDTREEWAS